MGYLHKPNGLQNEYQGETEPYTYGIETHGEVIPLMNGPCMSHIL